MGKTDEQAVEQMIARVKMQEQQERFLAATLQAAIDQPRTITQHNIFTLGVFGAEGEAVSVLSVGLSDGTRIDLPLNDEQTMRLHEATAPKVIESPE